MTDSYHIMHFAPAARSSAHAEQPLPLPITFYLSREILADDVITNAALADLLLRDLEAGISYHRDRLMSNGYDKPCTCMRSEKGGLLTPICGSNQCPRHVRTVPT